MLRLMKHDKKTAVFLCGMNKKYYLCSIVAATPQVPPHGY